MAGRLHSGPPELRAVLGPFHAACSTCAKPSATHAAHGTGGWFQCGLHPGAMALIWPTGPAL